MADWSEQCAARGAGLSHAHWSACLPPAPHPRDPGTEYEGRVHEYGQCCQCEEQIGARPGSEPTTPPIPVVTVTDHTYVATLGGRCGRHGCGVPAVGHAATQRLTDAQAASGVCHVKHESLSPKLLIGDGGWVWTTCPQCGDIIEPKLATGTPAGKADGIGRGSWINPRLRNRWQDIKNRLNGSPS